MQQVRFSAGVAGDRHRDPAGGSPAESKGHRGATRVRRPTPRRTPLITLEQRFPHLICVEFA